MSHDTASSFALPASNLDAWARLAVIEPRLLDIESDIRTVPNDGGAFWTSYEKMKRLLRPLVGHAAERRELRTHDAWDVCHRRLLAVLEGRA